MIGLGRPPEEQQRPLVPWHQLNLLGRGKVLETIGRSWPSWQQARSLQLKLEGELNEEGEKRELKMKTSVDQAVQNSQGNI